MGPIRGRPCKIEPDKITYAVLNHKNEVLLSDNTIVAKSDEVWKTISCELNNVILPKSLYTFVTCNKYGLRDELLNRGNSAVINNHEPLFDSTIENDMAEISRESVSPNTNSFVISLNRSEYEDLLLNKSYKRTESDRRKPYTRHCLVLQPGKWQKLITTKIWDQERLKCGWNFENHKITVDGRSGYIIGNCNCGANLRCDIDNSNPEADLVSLQCTVKAGSGDRECGKTYLRAPGRQQIAKELEGKLASVYRAEMASELMLPGEPEPPHLYTEAVLNTAKHEYASSQHLDRDPQKALAIMKLGSMKNSIHGLGLNPFFAHYWTNHQLHVYREYCSRGPACICIDATGSLVKKIRRPDKSESSHIFLYECVVNCSIGGQYSVAQMITESHNTNSIHFWLMEWIRTGAPPPKEVVCDSAKALLTAAVRAFTDYSTIDDYADGCKLSSPPKCYIRIDVAHFIKMYARFMKNINGRIKKFFLTALGQLILSCDLDATTEILTSILIVARSETEGEMENGQKTYCEIHKLQLRDIFTGVKEVENLIEGVNDEPSESDAPLEEDNSPASNAWATWAKDIDNRVKSMVQTTEGDRDNAHYFPQLADRLVKDLKWLPLWSCVCRNQFGYGRVPASSAPVEGDFNNLKNRVLRNVTLPMRADNFIKRHTDFINGRTKIVDAQPHVVISPPSPVTVIEAEQVSMSQKDSQPSLSACPTCPACSNGHYPAGGHLCALCSRPVHALDQCSTAIEDESEGYGQRRICSGCKNTSNLPVILASREVEDWRGLVAPVEKKKGRYLQKSYTANEFILHEKLKKMPIMKNGSTLTLQSVKFGRERISLCNTCAFDSVLQIFLAGVQDRPLLKEAACNKYKGHKFFKLILNILSKGVTNSAYRLRSEILRELFPVMPRPNNSSLVRCDVVIADLARDLFKEIPALSEISVCDRGCPPRPKSLAVLQVVPCSLTDGSFYRIMAEKKIHEPQNCCTKGCMGLETTSITEIGDFVAFDVFPIVGDPDRCEIQLANIPTELEVSETQNYHLVGVVNFEPPATKRSTRSSMDNLGHYTAISRRPGDTWIRYDDTKEKQEILSKSKMVFAHLIVYAP